MSEEKVPNWLFKRAALTSGRIAVTDGEEAWTFAELNIKARETARRLFSAGVRKGDFAAVLLANNADAVRMIYALQYLGAVIVLLNTRLTESELKWQIIDSKSSHLIYDVEFEIVAQKLKSVGARAVSFEELSRVPRADFEPDDEIELSALHTVIYTSGVTGRPKGVMLTNSNHWWSAVGSALNLGLQQGDKWIICAPLFHMSGFSIALRCVIYGITMIVHEKFSPEKVNRCICGEGASMISVVSSMLSRMLDDLGERAYPETLRCVLTGGGPVPEPLLHRCRSKNIPVYQTYGLSETASQFATLAPGDLDRKLGSAGKPLFMSELKIMNEGRVSDCGQPGEIVVRGPNVAAGYLNRDIRELKDEDGWMRTGDCGYLDSDGFLYVLDRRSDLIISGGENIYPAEIEAVLSSHPQILEAGAAGLSDPDWGRIPVAFVVLKSGAPRTSSEDLDRFCRERLAGYKCPKRFVFLERLPRTASNKLLRRELLAYISGAPSRKLFP